ncbi:MAG: cation transporter [Nitrospirota bacterium]|nr:MAG: cation transporter [Nitrospirota bacterium]
MKSCCKEIDAGLLKANQRRVLIVVLGINVLMFFVEIVGGIVGHSTSLLADSLDMLGDALSYGISLFALDQGMRWKARAALVKGIIMMVFGMGVLIEAIAKSFLVVLPSAQVMGVIGFLALAANLGCLLLLTPHKNDDVNLRSTWVCSRNDIIANMGVLVAAAGVILLTSKWPDILVGLGVALVFLTSAYSVLKESLSELQVTTSALEDKARKGP